MVNFKGIVGGVVFSALLIFATNTVSIPLDDASGDAAPAPENREPVNKTEPKLADFQESRKLGVNSQSHPESRVHIVVGEDNGFQYTVDGHTYSRERIAISGEYFNDEVNAYGYVRLFLVAEPSISYYAVRPAGDRLDVYVQNYYYEEFFYTIYTPYPVSGYDLRHGQVNGTAVLATGPSRSAVYDDRKNSHGKKKPASNKS